MLSDLIGLDTCIINSSLLYYTRAVLLPQNTLSIDHSTTRSCPNSHSCNHKSLDCVHSSVFSRMSHSLDYMICSFFSDWLHSLSNNMHLMFLHVFFHGLTTHFFSTLNNSPLSGCTTAYLSIHLLKDILVASKS